jgi:CRISPR-associated protein Cas2
MPRKKYEISFRKKMKLLQNAAIKENKNITKINLLLPLDKRILKILNIIKPNNPKNPNMIFFIMYDIENDKVRREVSKYLERNGCFRVQKSIFFASAPHELYKQMHNTLKEVQETYQNNDSIFFVPVSTDEVKRMKIIGKSIDFDLFLGNRNTLFF